MQVWRGTDQKRRPFPEERWVRGEGEGVGVGVCRSLRGPGSRSFRNTHARDRHIQLSKENP